MVEPSKIPAAFAVSGDKNVIPENSTTTGAASWSAGFPAITSVPVSQGGVAPARADFNGILNALSLGLMWLQQGNHYAYDETIDYNPGALVSDSGSLYFCKQTNGPGSVVVAPGDDADVWGLLLDSNGNSTINTTGHAGNASVATKALQDGNGNVIVDTYLTTDSAEANYLTQTTAADTYATKAEDSAKLPLSGGTMTGNIEFSNSTLFRNVNSSGLKGLWIQPNGVSDANTAIMLFAEDSATYPNSILLRVKKGTSYKQLILSPNDDSLEWGGKTVECALQKGNGYLKLSDGTQICWGTGSNSTASFVTTFDRSFKTAPIVTCSYGDTVNFASTLAISKTSVTNTGFTVHFSAGTAVARRINYIAIGEGV